MCGRYVTKESAAEEAYWKATPNDLVWADSYNVAPSQRVPIVRVGDGGGPELTLMRWGLVPFWAKGKAQKYSTINARAETIEKAASYRGPWKRRQRCIFPVNGFYEWQVLDDNKSKQAWYIYLNDRPVFGLAGLWDASVKDDGEVILSATIITVDANSKMAEIHNTKRRMPVILEENDHDVWLSGDVEDAAQRIVSYDIDNLGAHPVSSFVNSPTNNDERCIQGLG